MEMIDVEPNYMTRSWSIKGAFSCFYNRNMVEKLTSESNGDFYDDYKDHYIPSNATRQKVVVAKQIIENHYKSQKRIMQERRERYFV